MRHMPSFDHSRARRGAWLNCIRPRGLVHSGLAASMAVPVGKLLVGTDMSHSVEQSCRLTHSNPPQLPLAAFIRIYVTGRVAQTKFNESIELFSSVESACRTASHRPTWHDSLGARTMALLRRRMSKDTSRMRKDTNGDIAGSVICEPKLPRTHEKHQQSDRPCE